MLVLNRFVVPAETRDGAAPADPRDGLADGFVDRAHAALAALAARPGYVSGRLTRAIDDPDHWTLVTEWESVGAYRRALGDFDVKVHATPLLALSVDTPSAFETLASAPPGGPVEVTASDRAAEPWR
jgi:hypothetical protein